MTKPRSVWIGEDRNRWIEQVLQYRLPVRIADRRRFSQYVALHPDPRQLRSETPDPIRSAVSFEPRPLAASLIASLVLAFAVLSLTLASVGLYGVLLYLTAQRTGEIGVRLALGAQRAQVLRLVVGDGLRPAHYGLAFGLASSPVADRMFQSMLYGTRPLEPAIFAAVAATMLAVAAPACLVPAWKAPRIDPMQALRIE